MIITRNIVDTYEIPYIRTPICSLCKKACIDAYSDYFIEENRIYYNQIKISKNPGNKRKKMYLLNS